VVAEIQLARSSRSKRLIGLVCLLLTLAAAIGEASHLHLKAEAGNAPIRCSICVAAHSAKPAPACQPLRAARVFLTVAVQQNPSAGSRLAITDLFVRPPPSAS
jgi:hypothetical protein